MTNVKIIPYINNKWIEYHWDSGYEAYFLCWLDGVQEEIRKKELSIYEYTLRLSDWNKKK